jgi:hypothetical protein
MLHAGQPKPKVIKTASSHANDKAARSGGFIVYSLPVAQGVGVAGTGLAERAAVGDAPSVGDTATVGDTPAVGVAFSCTTGGGAVATIGAVGRGDADGWGAPPKTKTLPKTMVRATAAPTAKFRVFARDHFFERPFRRPDFFGILSPYRTFSLGL